jgi:hypothetical protein
MVVKCRLMGEGFAGRRAPQLDALLAILLAQRVSAQPEGDPRDWPLPDIPIAKSACGRFFLCSSGEFEVEEHDEFIMGRRAPWIEYARFGDASITRVNISVAEDKSYFAKKELAIPKDDLVTWYALGHIESVRAILSGCHYLGKYRGSGKGRVREWEVSPKKTWGEGFPIMQCGLPLRPLPLETPGLDMGNSPQGYSTIAPPYWLKEREALVAVPA